MTKLLLPVFSAFLLVGALVACSSTSVSPSATDGGADGAPGSFGCCKDAIPGCTLYRNGPKRSEDDTCIDGYDGKVIDPSEDGWTKVTDAYGCGVWKAPANAKRIQCGVASPEPSKDAGTDANGGDASADANGGDASFDGAPDAGGD